jgi:hypothetical protein
VRSSKFGLIRGIREIRKDFDFANDQEYNVAMQAFKLTMRKLGFLGKTVDHIEKISLADLETLYASNTFNIHRPTSLQYKVFFEIQFFLMCSRGRNYLRNLMPSRGNLLKYFSMAATGHFGFPGNSNMYPALGRTSLSTSEVDSSKLSTC